MSVTHAFDAIAATYDEAFTHRLGRWLRAQVWAHVPFRAGDRVLELGCGTGEDAVWLAQRGVEVTATDASPAMLDVARRKVTAAQVAGRVMLAPFDMARLDAVPASVHDTYDGVFANFGALNCLPERRSLAAFLAQRVRPGGKALLVLMGPLCPWEVVWHLAHGRPRDAFRRLQAGALAHVGGGEQARVWYPSPRRLRAEFAPGFRLQMAAGVGVFLPPLYLSHLGERWPPAFERLATVDRRIGHVFPATWLNDHYLVVFERV
ncbi:MAG: methyltransferase domain-containing protein [Anaerolineae bacterium]|nr:methyltransferase domain-containing protein [Anaerolineae bacterium]